MTSVFSNSKFFTVRVCLWLAAGCLLAVAAGCGGAETDSAESGGRTVGVVMSTFTSPYAGAMIREFRRIGDERGLRLLLLDSQLDIRREAQHIDNLAGRGVDVLCVNAVDAVGSRAALRRAAESGIPVICSNSSVDEPEELGVRAYTGADYYQEAVVAAREALRRRPGGKIVMIAGTPGYSAAVERERGFRDTVEKEGPESVILDAQPGNWMREDAQRVMSDFITRYGREIDVVYCHDDNMTAGAVNALKAAGYTREDRPVVVSIGAMADGLELIQDGWIDASVMQSPKDDAQLAIDTALAVAEGR